MLLEDASFRKEMVARGEAQAAKFNWNTTWLKTMDFYTEVATGLTS